MSICSLNNEPDRIFVPGGSREICLCVCFQIRQLRSNFLFGQKKLQRVFTWNNLFYLAKLNNKWSGKRKSANIFQAKTLQRALRAEQPKQQYQQLRSSSNKNSCKNIQPAAFYIFFFCWGVLIIMDKKSSPVRRQKRQAKVIEENFWDCSVCTYRNSAEAFKCRMCDVRKGEWPRFWFPFDGDWDEDCDAVADWDGDCDASVTFELRWRTNANGSTLSNLPYSITHFI